MIADFDLALFASIAGGVVLATAGLAFLVLFARLVHRGRDRDPPLPPEIIIAARGEPPPAPPGPGAPPGAG